MVYKPVYEVMSFIFGTQPNASAIQYLTPLSVMGWCREMNVPYEVKNNELYVAKWRIPHYHGYISCNGLARLCK